MREREKPKLQTPLAVILICPPNFSNDALERFRCLNYLEEKIMEPIQCLRIPVLCVPLRANTNAYPFLKLLEQQQPLC